MTEIVEFTEPAAAPDGAAGRKSRSPRARISALARCICAKQRAYKEALAAGKPDYCADRIGDRAFLRAMPPLSAVDGIRDFIVCVAYAVTTEVIRHKDAAPLLDAARRALRQMAKTASSPGPRPAEKII
jgi:hypothetical protein